MRARQTQQATQIVKINLAGPKRRRRAPKKKPVVRQLQSGAPDTFRSENVAPPIPFYGRMGPQIEPIRVQRAEEPRQLRIEDFRENFVPPPAFRKYLTTLIEQPRATGMRVEEVKEERMEAPQPPLITVGPLAGMVAPPIEAASEKAAEAASSSDKPRRIIFELDDTSASDLFEMRDRGEITRESLEELPVKRKSGFGGLLEVAGKLGLVVPSKIKTGRKDALIDWILQNM